MADDAAAVLDDAGCDRAVVCGYSLGGMVAQTMAAARTQRVAGLVSLSSSTGEPYVGAPTPEAYAALTAPPAPTVVEQIEADLAAHRLWSNPSGSTSRPCAPTWSAATAGPGTPGASQRHFDAVIRSGSRAEQLRRLDVPALVIHGSIDTLISADAGRRTADLIPQADYLEIEGMGHELPPQVWAPIISAVTSLSGGITWY